MGSLDKVAAAAQHHIHHVCFGKVNAGGHGQRVLLPHGRRLRAGHGVTRAIDILLYAHGAGSFADVNPLQRIWHDSATAARHAVVLPVVGYEVHGKALLGVEEKITPWSRPGRNGRG